jgi:hypothetical protein
MKLNMVFLECFFIVRYTMTQISSDRPRKPDENPINQGYPEIAPSTGNGVSLRCGEKL